MSPKYKEVRDWVLTQIRLGNYALGDTLPTERELMKRFNVSRNPVQKAMTELAASGYVVRNRRQGTTVASTGMKIDLFKPLSSEVGAAEVGHTHQVVSAKAREASIPHPGGRPSEAATRPVAEIERIKIDDLGRPLVYERALIDLSVVPNILNEHLEDMVTFSYLKSKSKSDLVARTEVTAKLATAKIAKLLEIEVGDAVIQTRRYIESSSGSTIELSEYYFHPYYVHLEVNQIG